MYQFVIVFLLFACMCNIALSIDNVEDSNDLIRLPLVSISRERRAADENGLTTVTLEDPSDNQYGVPIEIGNPPQKFTVLLDSGSTDLWVSSVESKNKDAKHLFDENASSTYQKRKGNFFLGYVGASVNGSIAAETVSFGGLTVKNQPFGLANFVTPGTTPFDGIIGISYEAVALTDNSTIIDRLFEQGQIKKPISCVKLRPRKESKSEFIIGGCDVEADYWIPVLTINRRFTGWRLNLTKIVLRSTTNNSELLTVETNNEAVFDTGAGGSIGIPQEFLNPINDGLGAIWNGQHFLVDCANRTSLPNIEFYFGEAKVIMTLNEYSWVYFDECQLGFNHGGKDFLFGTLLFNSATVIFDKYRNRVGIAQKK